MFLSNNSSTSLNNNNNNNNNNNINNNCIDQQPMFDKPIFINDVSPNSKMYPPFPVHDQYYSSSFTTTTNTFHQNQNQNQNPNSLSPADDQDFINIAAFLQQHQDLLLVGQFSQVQQHSNNFTTSSTISKQNGIGITTTTTTTNDPTLPILNNNMNNNKNVVDGGFRREPAAVTLNWKRSSTTTKKDRHSKIVTAQGPRDRRMRLSLEIARRFFTLQDMLGFDKASKTVEWLLTKSKGAIKELTRSIKGSSNTSGTVSSISECEVASTFDDTTVNVDHDENKVQISNTVSSNPKEKRVKVTRKPTFHPPPLAKDFRTKARARARERTIEKIRSRSTVPYLQGGNNTHNINQLRAASSSYETGGEESGSQSHDMRSTSLEMVVEVEDHPPACAAARSNSLECQGPNIGEDYITRNATTTSPFFDYSHEIKTSQQGLNLNSNSYNNNCNYPENWDIDSGRAHSTYYSMANNMHLSTTDFQFVSKPWIT